MEKATEFIVNHPTAWTVMCGVVGLALSIGGCVAEGKLIAKFLAKELKK